MADDQQPTIYRDYEFFDEGNKENFGYVIRRRVRSVAATTPSTPATPATPSRTHMRTPPRPPRRSPVTSAEADAESVAGRTRGSARKRRRSAGDDGDVSRGIVKAKQPRRDSPARATPERRSPRLSAKRRRSEEDSEAQGSAKKQARTDVQTPASKEKPTVSKAGKNATPIAKEMTPAPSKATPKPKMAPFKAKKTPSKAKVAASKSKYVTPKAKVAARRLVTDAATPKSDEHAQASVLATPTVGQQEKPTSASSITPIHEEKKSKTAPSSQKKKLKATSRKHADTTEMEAIVTTTVVTPLCKGKKCVTPKRQPLADITHLYVKQYDLRTPPLHGYASSDADSSMATSSVKRMRFF